LPQRVQQPGLSIGLNRVTGDTEAAKIRQQQAQAARASSGLSVLDPLGRNKVKNQMSVNLVDLTHDSIHELYWRPIIRKREEKPGDNVLKDKLLLKDWE